MSQSITHQLYDSFQKAELDRFNGIISEDILINSPAAFGLSGLDTLKAFAIQFTGLSKRIDLTDEHLSLDNNGNGRGFITFTLYWKHSNNFLDLKPTGREGTSIETLILTIKSNKITRIDVADHTLDLAIYIWERGWAVPHNVQPEALIVGETRVR